MKYNVYCVRDELVGFMTPTIDQSDAIAVRNFLMACDSVRRDSSLMAWKPSDYSLYRVAVFDSDSGSITPVSPIERVCSGGDLNA